MKVTIEGRINVNGQWWDISAEHEFTDNNTPEKKVARIKAIIKGMASTGEIISRVGESPPQTPQANGNQPPSNEPKATQPQFTWPLPQCKVHREAMRESKTQKTPGTMQYFCPKRIGDNYCPQRAAVDVNTAIPKFWEVIKA